MEHANDLWQADTMFGPHIKHHTGKMTIWVRRKS